MIKEIDFGIAFRIKNTIYLNKSLNNHPRLRDALIRHELSHTSGFTMKDIMADIHGIHLQDIKKDYYKFWFLHPKAWYQFFPLIKIDKKYVFDPMVTILWLIASGVIFVTLKYIV